MKRALLCLLLGGCTQAAPGDAASAAFGASEEADAVVTVLDSGHYFGSYIYHGAWYDSVWVDLGVRNDGYDKQVGIVWTNDGWKTSHTSAASYEETLADGRERWGLDLKDAVAQVGWLLPGELEYAGFATIAGRTSWSVFRNHYIYGRVTPQQPLLLLQSSADLDASGKPTVRGVVRALNASGERRVFIRYSVDDWRHVAEVEAEYTGPDFAFALPVEGDPATIEEAVFALRLEARGEIAWDNHGGQDYHVRLAPRLAQASWNAPPEASAGPKQVSGALETRLPLSQVRLHLDDGSVLELSSDPAGPTDATLRFDAGGGFIAQISTAALGNGVHGVTIEAAAGPFVRSFTGPTFLAADAIRSLGGTAVGNGDTAWDFTRTAGGHTLVLTEQHVLDFASLGAQPTVFESGPAGLAVGRIAADGAGHVYALHGTTLTRWNAGGTLDHAFAGTGSLELQGTWDGTPLCYSSDVSADANGFLVVDSCNARLLRFALDGSFVDSLSLTTTLKLTQAQALERIGGTTWVSGYIYDTQSRWQLVEVSTPPGAPMQVAATHAVQGEVDDFTVDAGGFWTTWGSNLQRLAADGTWLATWTGLGNAVTSLPGNLGIAKRVAVLEDGSVEVLGVEASRLERFGGR